jgi:steroid delta-isomerase-like uncharacterized protein
MDLRQQTERIFHDLISTGDLSLVEELIAENYVDHRGPRGREGFSGGLTMVREAFPDWSSRIDQLVVEGDTVAARWTVRGTHQGPFMGLPGSGKTVEMNECGFLRFEDGRLTEIWRVADELSLMRQLGALPTP